MWKTFYFLLWDSEFVWVFLFPVEETEICKQSCYDIPSAFFLASTKWKKKQKNNQKTEEQTPTT